MLLIPPPSPPSRIDACGFENYLNQGTQNTELHLLAFVLFQLKVHFHEHIL